MQIVDDLAEFMFSTLKIRKRKSLLEISKDLDQIADKLNDSLISIRNSHIMIINVIHPNTIYCELHLYILD